MSYERQKIDRVRAVPFEMGFIDDAAFFSGRDNGGLDGIATDVMCPPRRGGASQENLDACAPGYLNWMRDRRHL